MEVSVVVLIIGLISATVMKSASLLRQARINKIVVDARKYQASIMAFKEKYNTYPGDLSNASSYWPSAQDGNGNKKIDFTKTSVNTYENVHLWKHLKLSGFLDSGIATASPSGASGVLGVDIPKASIDTAGYWNQHLDAASKSTYKVLNSFGIPKITMIVAKPGTTANVGASTNLTLLPTGFLTAAEAYNMDNKYDDGLPKSGDLMFAPDNSAAANTCFMDASDAFNLSNANANVCYIGILY
ncbi:MAG: prepilin-type N-terminal cleavage/methylation protein [Rickettsiaceae bacterium]|nr:prepilin-type N-terminal cleavage/methylation protein [Rickettsiaceae bacterium]